MNSSLRVLRSILHRAVEWGVLESVPRIKLLPGERHRGRVVTRDEEARYLAAAREPLASVATVLADTGLRPEECFRLRWEAITWVNGHYGTLLASSLRKQHKGAFKVVAEEAAKNKQKPVRPFVLYSLRHTFLTRLGKSGCDAWTLARTEEIVLARGRT